MTDLRTAMLQLLGEDGKRGGRAFHVGTEEEYFTELERRRPGVGREALDHWHDFYREGIISWGHNLSIPEDHTNHVIAGLSIGRGHFERGRPLYHVTARGMAALAEASRDPSNADGYLTNVDRSLPTDGIARSYVEEALHTYRVGCDLAATFLLGAAAESLTLHFRDLVKANPHCRKRKQLDDRNIKTVINEVRQEVTHLVDNQHATPMPSDLKEQWDGVYPALAHFIRWTRNNTGHPTRLSAVSHVDAQGMFLAFACIAEMLHALAEWFAPGQWQ